MYGCEIWGFNCLDDIEAVASIFYCILLGLRKNPSIVFARGELGRNTVIPTVYVKIVKYWLKLITVESTRAIHQCYLRQYRLAERGEKCWAWEVKQLLFKYGCGYAWIDQRVDNTESFIYDFKQRCMDIDRQLWYGNVQQSNLLRFYKTIKSDLSLENYLKCELTLVNVNMIARLRGGLLRIAINEGRWTQVPLLDRKCPICNLQEIENEEHFVLKCPAWSGYRGLVLRKFTDLQTLFEEAKFNKNIYWILCEFIKNCVKVRSEILEVL